MSEQNHLTSEKMIGLHEAARRLPPGRNNRPVSYSCVLRWITHGCIGPDGQRVRLEGVRVGARWLTTEEALARWAERLTPCRDSGPTPRSAARRHRASESAGQKLDDLGI